MWVLLYVRLLARPTAPGPGVGRGSAEGASEPAAAQRVAVAAAVAEGRCFQGVAEEVLLPKDHLFNRPCRRAPDGCAPQVVPRAPASRTPQNGRRMGAEWAQNGHRMGT